jgi:hypothetical protein
MNDDELMIVLREVLAEDEQVSPRSTEAAESAFRWLRVDDELAELVFDSADTATLAGVRGAPQRQLTYRFDDLLIDCEVSHDTLLGQLIPLTPARVELWSADGARRLLDLDKDGRFVAKPPPSGPVNIRCSRPGHNDIVTPWLLVSSRADL